MSDINDFFDEAEIKTGTPCNPFAGASRQEPKVGLLTIQEVILLVPERKIDLYKALGFEQGKAATGPARVAVSKNEHTMVMFKGVFAPDDGPEGEVYSPVPDCSISWAIVPGKMKKSGQTPKDNWIASSTIDAAPLFAAAGHDLTANTARKRLMPVLTQGDAEGCDFPSVPGILAEMAVAAGEGRLVARYGGYQKEGDRGVEVNLCALK